MEEQKEASTKNWAAFGGQYLKAENVLSDKDKYVITKVSSQFEKDKQRNVVHLTLEYEGVSKLFGCNQTNEYAVKESCPNSPEQAIGRIITFNKVQVEKPGSVPREMVDGLRIQFVPLESVKEVTIPENSGIAPDGTI